MTTAAAPIIDHCNTAAENWLLIASGAASLALAWLIAHAVRDCWDALVAAREHAANVAADQQSAIESWCAWLPTRESVAVVLTKLEAGEFHVLPPPVSIKRRRLAAVAAKGRRAA